MYPWTRGRRVLRGERPGIGRRAPPGGGNSGAGAWDALTDFLEIFLRPVPPAVGQLLRLFLETGGDTIINAIVSRGAHEPLQEWAMAQAMHVFGLNSAAAVLRAAASYRTQDVSALVRQHVLLLAGAEDHYVPNHQIYDQAEWLSDARSVTTRMFTRAENGEGHCQVGNLLLAVDTIADWMNRPSATRDEGAH